MAQSNAGQGIDKLIASLLGGRESPKRTSGGGGPARSQGGRDWTDEYFKGADKGIQDLVDFLRHRGGKKAAPPSSGSKRLPVVPRLSEADAAAKADRDIAASRYPHDFQPGGRFSTLFEQQVPKARRELSETLFAQRLGRFDSNGKPQRGGSDTGSARNPVGSADKRLKGKRGVKPGEI